MAIGTGTAILAGSLASGYMAKRAGDKASKRHLKGAKAGVREQARQFDLTRKDTAPYREVGRNAILQLRDLQGLGDEGALEEAFAQFETDPGYQFRFDEGQRALENSQAARGGRLGGRAVKEATRYGQGMASGEYGNYIERLFRSAGLGGGATNTSATAGAQSANAIGNLHMAGQRGAAGAETMGYQGMNQAIQGGIGNWVTAQYMNRHQDRMDKLAGM